MLGVLFAMTKLTTDMLSKTSRLVWDVPTRLFHWSLVLCMLASWGSAELGKMSIHFWSGYTLLGLLCFRIIWGFIGTRHARFATFFPRPKSVLSYLQSLPKTSWTPSAGHSPIGAVAVFVLLFALGTQAVTGLFATDDIIWSGPYNAAVSQDLGSNLTSIHHKSFNVLVALIGVHIAAVLAYWILKATNLTKPMITGRKSTLQAPNTESIEPPKLWRVALAVGLAILFIAVLLGAAPEPTDDFYY